MDNIFIFDENVQDNDCDEDYVNENEIIYREKIQSNNVVNGIYDINKLITKDIYRENILLSNVQNDNTYTINDNSIRFNFMNTPSNGIQYKTKIIGFKLNECIYSAPIYNIKTNQKIKFIENGSTKTITIPKSYYTINKLLDTINNSTLSVNGSFVSDYIFFSYDNDTSKVNIKHIVNISVCDDPTTLIFFQKLGIFFIRNLINENIIGTTHPSLSQGFFLDVVVDEIPYKACKQNLKGRNIIHRIPINPTALSSIIYYRANYIENMSQYLFFPISLSQLTVRLYVDEEPLPMENMTISFDFELVILNK